MKAIVDCNSFYCSCERLFRPDLERQPVVVLSNNDGCIISRTDEAKKIGVGMAAPYYQNKELIEKNKVAVFSSNYHLYGDLSMRVMDTLRLLVGPEQVEVYSVDEAFLDLDEMPPHQMSLACYNIKETVEQWTGIKVSLGAAPSKVLSKVANRLAKKEKIKTQGVVLLQSPGDIQEALQRTSVEDIWGIGRQYALKLRHLGIDNGWQLRNMPEPWVHRNLGGVVGVRLLRELRGIPCIAMKDPLETKKMIATSRMFGKPVFALKDIREAVATYVSRAAEKLRRQFCVAGSLQVYVVTNGYQKGKYEYNPQSRYRHASCPVATAHTAELIQLAMPLVEKLYTPGLKYLKAGVILSRLVPDNAIQTNLFRATTQHPYHHLMATLDNINTSYRDDMIKYLSSGLQRNWKMRQELRSQRFTTRWNELYELK